MLQIKVKVIVYEKELSFSDEESEEEEEEEEEEDDDDEEEEEVGEDDSGEESQEESQGYFVKFSRKFTGIAGSRACSC